MCQREEEINITSVHKDYFMYRSAQLCLSPYLELDAYLPRDTVDDAYLCVRHGLICHWKIKAGSQWTPQMLHACLSSPPYWDVGCHTLSVLWVGQQEALVVGVWEEREVRVVVPGLAVYPLRLQFPASSVCITPPSAPQAVTVFIHRSWAMLFRSPCWLSKLCPHSWKESLIKTFLTLVPS